MVRERGLAAKATYFPRSHGHQPVREMQIKPPQLVRVGWAARAPSSSSGRASGSWKLLAAAGAGVGGVGRSLVRRQHRPAAGQHRQRPERGGGVSGAVGPA